MHTIVCIKQIIDPEIPADQFKLDASTKRQVRGGLSLVISAYDQNALEVALQLREKVGGKVTALCLGESGAMGAIKTALGMAVDEGVLVSDPPLLESDPFGVVHILAKAIQKIGVPDLVLTGCVSGDTGDKVMGPLIAEELGLPCVTFVSKVEVKDGKALVRRIVEDGYELVEAAFPLVVSIISDDSNVPRYSKLKDIMVAAKKQVPTWKTADLGLDGERVGAGAARLQMRDVSIPERDSKCEILDGETPEERAERLALRLRELKVI
ncbi:MAG: electron transfer flavoprotein subunit beta [candidate division NC10 bacterium RIFCSPLOWO2_12_FULL_66_18]|nr:MAG: electron transfer flavoprotein subunit beta [candidate division NC10 bacterium RIFCSPLOWO2_02_FULL_66_22]OGC01949.1 MAG: electron transfer flavoprotein subunit beta [candidate division NC10 bacterium RIFCSPLOWO2_12_FULL_66_18]